MKRFGSSTLLALCEFFNRNAMKRFTQPKDFSHRCNAKCKVQNINNFSETLSVKFRKFLIVFL